ncbi:MULTISPECIES: his operon leader peptide [Hafniaceae]|uniref:his operon leader peptide n=2 Tax=Hafnia TaxID=568 RepID=A0A4S1CU47_9GAMM|nr:MULTISPECIES: his operon leader peptide [Hafniaceae]MDN6019949.1 his operon leader peptide [Enterobacterales bacterium]MDU1192351.1 his operon leader peptide [Enterobacteriaceae bacterium]NEY26726.1 his operon leader peptide [Escherichia coli]AVE16784.1 histidine operon leader peptide [Hafnia paralvei]KAA0264883.1 his operon leader peptide [Hafnia alvei]
MLTRVQFSHHHHHHPD